MNTPSSASPAADSEWAEAQARLADYLEAVRARGAPLTASAGEILSRVRGQMAPEAVPTTSSLLRLALEDLSNMLQELGVPWTKAAMADAEANLLSGALVVAPPLSFNSMVPQRLIAADTTVGAAVPSET